MRELMRTGRLPLLTLMLLSCIEEPTLLDSGSGGSESRYGQRLHGEGRRPDDVETKWERSFRKGPSMMSKYRCDAYPLSRGLCLRP